MAPTRVDARGWLARTARRLSGTAPACVPSLPPHEVRARRDLRARRLRPSPKGRRGLARHSPGKTGRALLGPSGTKETRVAAAGRPPRAVRRRAAPTAWPRTEPERTARRGPACAGSPVRPNRPAGAQRVARNRHSRSIVSWRGRTLRGSESAGAQPRFLVQQVPPVLGAAEVRFEPGGGHAGPHLLPLPEVWGVVPDATRGHRALRGSEQLVARRRAGVSFRGWLLCGEGSPVRRRVSRAAVVFLQDRRADCSASDAARGEGSARRWAAVRVT